MSTPIYIIYIIIYIILVGYHRHRPIELWIEGELEDSHRVSLDPGAVESLTFTVSREEPGIYRLAVDGMAGDFRVSEEEEFAWWPLGLAVGLGLLVAAGAYSLWTRRRPATKTG